MEMRNSIRFGIIALVMIIASQVVYSLNYDFLDTNIEYIYNSFTFDFDMIRSSNFTGENVSADFFFGDGSKLTGVSSTANVNNTAINVTTLIIPSLSGCDTVNTTVDGKFICGTDSGAATEVHCNASGACASGDVAYLDFLNSGNITIDNWFKGKYNISSQDTWIIFDKSSVAFNESRLSSVYHNATKSAFVAGTLNAGTLFNTQHLDGKYDGVTFNFTEVAGSPGLDLRLNFTNITDFNQGVMRYKTSTLSGVFPIVQLWNYDTSTWEDYPAVAESLTFATIPQPVFDSTDHISNGVVRMRIYKLVNGNINNHYYVDWVAIISGYGVPSGEEVDPFWQADKSNYYNTTDINDIVDKNVTAIDANLSINRNLIDSQANETDTNCSVLNSCPLVLYNTGFAAGNITGGEIIDARILNDITLNTSSPITARSNITISDGTSTFRWYITGTTLRLKKV